MKKTIPIILGLIGTISAGLLVFSVLIYFDITSAFNFYFYAPYPLKAIIFLILRRIFVYSVYILPFLLGLAGIIKLKKKPVLVGTLMLVGGIISFYNFSMFMFTAKNFADYDALAIVPALFLATGGIWAIIKNKTK